MELAPRGRAHPLLGVWRKMLLQITSSGPSLGLKGRRSRCFQGLQRSAVRLVAGYGAARSDYLCAFSGKSIEVVVKQAIEA